MQAKNQAHFTFLNFSEKTSTNAKIILDNALRLCNNATQERDKPVLWTARQPSAKQRSASKLIAVRRSAQRAPADRDQAEINPARTGNATTAAGATRRRAREGL